MKKIKIFFSLLKERDYLEDMARNGYIFTNISLGMIYHFKECTPCEKVFEIERFAITSHPTVADLTARTRAMDITSQFGWEPVTHDEDMNYYFMKDKAGDETDEFYDDTESRIERAERYRKHFCMEQTGFLTKELLGVTLIYLVGFWLLKDNTALVNNLIWIYTLLVLLVTACIYGIMKKGQCIYDELCMSREEWLLHKKHNEKKRFHKVQQHRSFLQEKSEFGLSLTGYKNGYYTFEEDSQRYNYFIDTKRSMKNRMKKEGLAFADEKKDLMTQSLQWHELSIANASRYDLKPVAAIGKYALIYKRPFSNQPMPWENGNENLNFCSPTKAMIILFAGAFILGIVIGLILGALSL